MKKIFTIIGIVLLLTSCDVLQGILINSGGVTKPGLTQQEVAQGLKEALTVGIANTVDIVSQLNGYYRNPEIKIPFPEEAIKVKEYCEKMGLKNQVTQFEEKLNRAAEEAAKEAKDVFVAAIRQMTINDAINILKGSDDEATQYLRKTTYNILYDKFYPKVIAANEKVMLAKYWTPLADKYNKAMSITGGQTVNTDLNDYVTKKALDGLFIMVAKEEQKIRQDPVARINDILKKVFGSDLNPYNSKS
ncbi:MAG TPA: DUF4197 domain-containing protein [Bacteroidales bacterium]|nr:DUF4197 domain-containing protein [Bacteroidales bacterium]HOL98618.1 DUF4197 domain-containing protein [Bacteroidales bacterium]HOM37002.1 DUF4197 domain-containing protein [Bacteroidales bacterium]HPD24112.1 DUF4197 domain-containing protein [Bacteroidales bacterium]HRS99314.1 DUF4197 domain-containing protein [Bacteroidales bacterium]